MRPYYHLYFLAMHFQEMQLRMNMRAGLAGPGLAGPGLDGGGNVLSGTTLNRQTGHSGRCVPFGSDSAPKSPRSCLRPRQPAPNATR